MKYTIDDIVRSELRSIMDRKGMTAADFCRWCDISQVIFSRIMGGKQKSVDEGTWLRMETRNPSLAPLANPTSGTSSPIVIAATSGNHSPATAIAEMSSMERERFCRDLRRMILASDFDDATKIRFVQIVEEASRNASGDQDAPRQA